MRVRSAAKQSRLVPARARPHLDYRGTVLQGVLRDQEFADLPHQSSEPRLEGHGLLLRQLTELWIGVAHDLAGLIELADDPPQFGSRPHQRLKGGALTAERAQPLGITQYSRVGQLLAQAFESPLRVGQSLLQPLVQYADTHWGSPYVSGKSGMSADGRARPGRIATAPRLSRRPTGPVGSQDLAVLYLSLKRSIRPAVSTRRCFPV